MNLENAKSSLDTEDPHHYKNNFCECTRYIIHNDGTFVSSLPFQKEAHEAGSVFDIQDVLLYFFTYS